MLGTVYWGHKHNCNTMPINRKFRIDEWQGAREGKNYYTVIHIRFLPDDYYSPILDL